mmetsp:Transcript_1326/g.3635  ORF Transcript_1326/g.3635 Transcript_1326/m.3635 type:complete len:94 (+) Transcript_1326:73-354(+)
MEVDCSCPSEYRAELLPQMTRRGNMLEDFIQLLMTVAPREVNGVISVPAANGMSLIVPTHQESQFSRDPEKCFTVAKDCFRLYVHESKLPIFN